MISAIVGLISLATGLLFVSGTGLACFIAGYHMTSEAVCKGGYLDTKASHSKYNIMEEYLDPDKFMTARGFLSEIQEIDISSTGEGLKNGLNKKIRAVTNVARAQVSNAGREVKNGIRSATRGLVKEVVKEVVDTTNPLHRRSRE